ncbi:Phage major tail protein TP901-1 [uncultured Caudovirales phage]|uniref:Phage major tail protein TP901-1 n=1 Tax=uncultured Caudovirales phage TaxID=2100421 RepID=A0A6J7WFA6_9CAUD|nr:Phage major tail protein TP901-1 [uncultured Caudovirales phage]
MPSVVNGENVILYYKNPAGVFYFNGGISEGMILGNIYSQISSIENVGVANDFLRANDGIIRRFVTDANQPNITSLVSGTWAFEYYASIDSNVASSPYIYFIVKKYDGTTLTTIATSANTNLTTTDVKKYTNSVSIPTTTLTATDRIVIEVWAGNIGDRTVVFYTQGTKVAKVATTIPIDQVFGASTNCTFDVSVDQVEVTSQTSAWFREYKIDVAGWNISCDGLICLTGYSYKNMLDTQLAKSTIGIKFSIDDGTTPVVITGNAIINSISLTGPNNNTSTYSVSLTGVGAYTIT